MFYVFNRLFKNFALLGVVLGVSFFNAPNVLASGMIEVLPSTHINPQESLIIPVAFASTDSNQLRLASLNDSTPDQLKIGTTWSIQMGSPQIISASVGWVIGNYKCYEATLFNCVLEGVLVQVQPGITGLKTSVGYAVLGYIQLGHSDMGLFETPATGYDLKLSHLIPWSEMNSILRHNFDNSYFGVEGDVSLFFAKLSLGLFYRFQALTGYSASPLNPQGIHDWLLSLSFGVGF